jgi:hypothetical protein
VAERDDVLAVHSDAVLTLEKSWKLVLRPFIRGYRIPDWTFQYRDSRTEAIV